jgi:hypothetical protein
MSALFSRKLERVFLLAFVILLSACAHTFKTVDKAPKAGETRCCSLADRYPRWLVEILDPAAPIVGRTIALFSWRRGYLATHADARAEIKRRIHPLDILIVSNKGRLSGNTIPGLFGHSALYLGNANDLKRLGVWNSPTVRPYRQAVLAGRSVIESDQKGVHLSALDDVLNTDRVVVLRSYPGVIADRKAATELFFQHVGSNFDFHFDANEDKTLFCVELIRHILPELGIRSTIIYRRTTLLPDAVVMQALHKQNRLRVVEYLRAGQRSWDAGTSKDLDVDIRNAWR